MLRAVKFAWFAFRHRKCPGLIAKQGPDIYAVYCRTHNDGMIY